MPIMRKTQREKTFDLRTSLLGLASVVLCIAALLFVMEIVIVVARFVVG